MRATPGLLRAGYTLLELVLAGALSVLVLTKGVFVVQSIVSFSGDEASRLTLEDRAEVLLDRIAYSLMGADRPASSTCHATARSPIGS